MNHSTSQAIYLNLPALPAHMQQRYCHALERELALWMERSDGVRVRSIFIAGDALSYEQQASLPPPLDTLGILISKTPVVQERTLVIPRPTTKISERKISAQWYELGVNRINCSIQDRMYKHWLAYLRDVPCNKSIDLMMGEADNQHMLQDLLAVGVGHVSLLFAGDAGADDAGDAQAAQYEQMAAQLTDAGFEQYTTYDFALPGQRSVQQEVYHAYEGYHGFGVGACSFDGAVRTQVTDSVADYCAALEQATPAGWYSTEQLSAEEQRFERMMLALTGSGMQLDAALHEKIAPLVAAGLLVVTGERVACTVRGHLVVNEVIKTLY